MTITLNITVSGGDNSIHVAVENMSAQSAEMGFAKGLVEAVEKYANEHGK